MMPLGTRVAHVVRMIRPSASVVVIRRCFVVMLLASALAACGGSTESSGASSSGSSGASSSGASPTPSGAPVALGIYHLDQVDATNLEIRADGAFQWTIEGCDFGGGQCGAWTERNGKLVLSGGPQGLEWTHAGSFKQRMQTVTVTQSGDDVTVSGTTNDGESFTQTWKKGRSCAVCGGQLGPTGQEACTVPLPQQCGS